MMMMITHPSPSSSDLLAFAILIGRRVSQRLKVTLHYTTKHHAVVGCRSDERVPLQAIEKMCRRWRNMDRGDVFNWLQHSLQPSHGLERYMAPTRRRVGLLFSPPRRRATTHAFNRVRRRSSDQTRPVYVHHDVIYILCGTTDRQTHKWMNAGRASSGCRRDDFNDSSRRLVVAFRSGNRAPMSPVGQPNQPEPAAAFHEDRKSRCAHAPPAPLRRSGDKQSELLASAGVTWSSQFPSRRRLVVRLAF